MINPGIPETKSEAVDIKEYVAILLKRKWLILVCFLLSMAGTTAFLFTRQPVYRANAKLLVTASGSAVPASEITRDDESRFYATQIDIMLSQTMLKRVQLRMKKTPDEIRENLVDLKVAPVRNSSIIMISVDSTSPEFAKEFADKLADEYFHFRDEQRAQSSESALLMLTREANRLAQEMKASEEKYVAYAKEHNLPMLKDTSAAWWRAYYISLAEYARLKQTLVQSQAKLDALNQSNPSAFIALVSQEMVSQTGKTPNAADLMAQAMGGATNATPPGVVPVSPDSRAASGVNAPALTDQMASSVVGSQSAGAAAPAQTTAPGTESKPSTVDQSLAVYVSALPHELTRNLGDLEQRRLTLESQLEDMRRMYKPRHPALVAAEQELADIRQKISFQLDFARNVQKAEVASLQQQYDAATIEMKRLEAEGLEKSTSVLNGTAMADDIERIRSLYNALLNQLMKLDVSQNFSMRTVSVLEPAILEPEPVYPKKVKGLLVAAFFGLGLGLGLAFFIEYIDDSIKLAEEVERDLQLPFLGMIPAAQWNPDDLTAHRLDKLKQQGGVAEAYRVVRSAIIFSIPRDKLRSILLTSAVPREGKTTTCVNLSIGFAQTEERVLLIDADLRRGEIHKYFGIEKDKGLADILLGEVTPEEVIKHTDVPRLDLITVGSYPANPAELLLGWRLKELLEWGYKHYDRVIIDCTPVMGIADSAILGSAVDGVLFIIWAGRTSRRYVRVAKMTAVSRGAKVFGFVLNNLEPGRVGYYHYYPYYYSYYSRGYYYAHKEEDEGKGGDIKGIEVASPDEKTDEMDDVY